MVEKVPPQIPVKFVDVTEQAGLAATLDVARADLRAFVSPGACFFDYDGDGRIDLFLPTADPKAEFALFHNLGGGKFERRQ